MTVSFLKFFQGGSDHAVLFAFFAVLLSIDHYKYLNKSIFLITSI